MKTDSRPQHPAPNAGRDEPARPLSDSDRLLRGLPLESGEAQPRPPSTRLH